MSRKKKNPSTAQWVIIGVGSALGVGLVGYGVSRLVKGSGGGGDQSALGSGNGTVYEYTLEEGVGKQTGRAIYTARVRKVGSKRLRWKFSRYSKGKARTAAEDFIRRRAGEPVFVES